MTIEASVIKHSISFDSYVPEIYSMQLRYPRFIHAELMTHRVFSRNASSSRAIPVHRLINDILADTAMPIHWGANQKGMQALKECNAKVLVKSWYAGFDKIYDKEDAWFAARDEAIKFARAYSDSGYHKQIVNRLLEPFSHINVLVTSTDWNNFFGLRCHPDAQPEIRELSECVKMAQKHSTPRLLFYDDWHLPFVEKEDYQRTNLDNLIKLSVARSARVSYLTHEGKLPDLEEDLKLYDRLLSSVPLHASPAEHQASPDTKSRKLRDWYRKTWDNPQFHGNFVGWIQYRKTLPNEYIS